MNRAIKYMVVFILVSCSRQPKWVEQDPDLNSLTFDSVQIDKFSFDGHPLILTNDELVKFFGEAHSNNIYAGFMPDSLCSKIINDTAKKGVRFVTNDYSGYYFAPINKEQKLIFIDFTKTDKLLKYEDLVFSSKTSLGDLKKFFPSSVFYKNQCPGHGYSLSRFEIFIDSLTMNNINEKGYEFIYLNIVGRECAPAIEMTFVDNRLSFLRFL